MGRPHKSRNDPASLRKRAEAITGADKPPSPESMSPEEAARTLQELRVHQIELQMQNEELRRAQVELDAARARYFDLYDLAPVGYLTVSEKGLILETNITAARLLGVERGALAKRRLTSFILPEDGDLYYLQRKQVLESGLQQVSEIRMARPDGSQFWARVEAAKAESPEGAPVLRVVVSDITRSKHADEELRRSNTVLAGINTIFEEGFQCKTEEELGQNCLRVAKQITGSSLGFIGTIGADGKFHDCAMSDSGWERCAVCDQAGHSHSTCSFNLHKLYGRTLQEGKSFLTNTPSVSPAGLGAFAGDPTLTCFLGVPLVEGGRTIGVMGIGNREGGYQQRELDSLEALALATTEALYRRRSEEALRQNEEQLYTIYQDAPLMMLIVDGGGRIRKANKFAEQCTGVSQAEMVGRCGGEAMRCLNALHDPRGCGYGPLCQTCTLRRTVLDTMATGNSHLQVEASLPLAAAGEGQQVNFLLSTVRLSLAGKSQVLATVQEVTELKRTEEKLRVSEARYRGFFENAAVGTAELDAHGRFTRVNDRYCQITGYSREELLRMRPGDFTHPEDRDTDQEKLASYGRGELPVYAAEKRYVRKDGGVVWAQVTAAMIADGGGKHSAGVIQDITERKLAEKALLLSEKLASVGRMAASIAHEINNPLAAVINALYLARMNADQPDSVRRYLETADDELKRVSHITRQTLGFYRESSAPTRVSVSSVIDSAVDLLRSKIKVKRVVIEKRYDGDFQVKVVAGELRQVIANVLANSLDAVTEDGAIRLRLSTSTCMSNGQRRIRVTVADNGTGIDAATLPHIFEPLFTTKGTTGSGLGLWVSKQIMAKHHGSIRVHSSTRGERRGTTLSIFLPAEGTPEDRTEITNSAAD
jgi:PAS domain S-box-containing protein